MLDKELLFKSFNGIDDDLLLRSESNSYKTATARKKKMRILAAAIGAVISIAILFVALTLYGGNGSSMDGYDGTTEYSTTSLQDASPEASSGYAPDNIAPGEWEDNDIRYESGQDN